MKSMLKKIFFKLLGERKKDYIRVILSGIFCISVVFFSTSVAYLPVLDLAAEVYGRMSTFSENDIEDYKELGEKE